MVRQPSEVGTTTIARPEVFMSLAQSRKLIRSVASDVIIFVKLR